MKKQSGGLVKKINRAHKDVPFTQVPDTVDQWMTYRPDSTGYVMYPNKPNGQTVTDPRNQAVQDHDYIQFGPHGLDSIRDYISDRYPNVQRRFQNGGLSGMKDSYWTPERAQAQRDNERAAQVPFDWKQAGIDAAFGIIPELPQTEKILQEVPGINKFLHTTDNWGIMKPGVNNPPSTQESIMESFKTIGKHSKLHKKGGDVHNKPGGSNVGKYKGVHSFAGPSGGAPAGSFPINTIKRGRAALAYAHNAPNPAGIRAAVHRKYPSIGKQQGGIIDDPRGQWDHPGQVTRIPGNSITMDSVPYPVLAMPDYGQPEMMQPGGSYKNNSYLVHITDNKTGKTNILNHKL